MPIGRFLVPLLSPSNAKARGRLNATLAHNNPELIYLSYAKSPQRRHILSDKMLASVVAREMHTGAIGVPVGDMICLIVSLEQSMPSRSASFSLARVGPKSE
jgi:hypothetical protein